MAVDKKRPDASEMEWLDLFEEDTLTPAQRREAWRKKRRSGQNDRKGREKKSPEKKEKAGKPERPADAQSAEDASEGGKRKKRKGRRKKTLKQSALNLLLKVAAIALVIYLLTQVIGGVFVAHDNNMYPAVRDGDLCITLRLGGYYNGDVVAYEYDGMTTFGRVVGIAGDVIEVTEENGLRVNNMSPYEVVFYRTGPQDPAVTYPYRVKEGEWFVLCDQREDAQDSRSFGAITKPKGKVVLQLRRRGF